MLYANNFFLYLKLIYILSGCASTKIHYNINISVVGSDE